MKTKRGSRRLRSNRVATHQFENIPVPTVEFLSKRVPGSTRRKSARCAQDRINEKMTLGAPARRDDRRVRARSIVSKQMVKASTAVSPFPRCLKTRRFGYDGKGQAKILKRVTPKNAWAAMRDRPSILESFVNFRAEVSIVAARASDGTFKAFDVTENEHRDHILHRSVAPARLAADVVRLKPSRPPRRLPRASITSVSLPSNFSSSPRTAAIASTSMRWPRAFTTLGTGPWTGH